MSYADPVAQRFMVLDKVRNEAYRLAMSGMINDDSVVLDLGAGTGVLGLIAASLGARRVYQVEPATPLEVAAEIAKANNLNEKLVQLPGKIEEIVLPEKVDIILSVFTGNFLLEEDLLPSLFHARDHFLKDGGRMLPDMGRMLLSPVSLNTYFDEQIGCWDTPLFDVDHAVMKKYAVNQIYYDHFAPVEHCLLADPAVLMSLDFEAASSASCFSRMQFTVNEAGPLHGFLGWFDMRLGDQWLSTSPTAARTHWRQAFLPLDPVVEVAPGEVIHVEINRPAFGEWSWKCEVGEVQMQHSTFLSRPFTPNQLAQKSPGYKPSLTNEGHAAKLVLNSLQGEISTDELARMLTEQAGFESHAAAMQFAQRLIEQYAD